MTADELNAIRYLTIGLAKETFKQDWESFGEEDDDYIREKIALDSYCEGVEDVLWILKNMKQEKSWIPVTERLPEDKQRVLVTRKSGTIGYITWNTWWNEQKSYPIDKVIAWMPLPEPYKGGKDNGNDKRREG